MTIISVSACLTIYNQNKSPVSLQHKHVVKCLCSASCTESPWVTGGMEDAGWGSLQHSGWRGRFGWGGRKAAGLTSCLAFPDREAWPSYCLLSSPRASCPDAKAQDSKLPEHCNTFHISPFQELLARTHGKKCSFLFVICKHNLHNNCA